MESPGEYLKREREHRGITLAAVHEATRISMKYLCALEADDLDAQPHATFTRGFIKSYCKHLGLDENDAVLRYEMFLKEKAERTDNYRADDDREVKARMSWVDKKYIYAALSAVVIIAGLYVILMRGSRKAAPLAASAAVQAAGTAVQPLPLPQPFPQTQPQPLPQVKIAAPLNEQVKTDDVKKAPVAKVEKVFAKDTLKSAINEAPEDSARQTPADTPKAADNAGSKEKKHTVSVTASELVWIKMGIDDKPAFNVILKAGESAAWKAVNGFHFVVGNAGGVSIKLDGKTLAPLGPSGKVVNINLPQGFGDVKTAAEPSH